MQFNNSSPAPFSYDELNKEMFQLFDSSGTGFIEVNDLGEIVKAMGYSKDEGKYIYKF